MRGQVTPHYAITSEERAWAGERIAALCDLVRAACEARLEEARGRMEG